MRILDFSDGFESSTEPEVLGIPASSIAVDPSGNLASDNAQDAFEELQSDIDDRALASDVSDHIEAAADAHEASAIANDPLGNLAADNVQDALDELQSDIDSRALASDLSSHLSDTTDAHDASAISSVPSGNLAASDVQTALNELQSDVDSRALASDLSAHLSDTSDAHDASAISSIPSGNLAATDVQGALNELQTDINSRALDSDLTAHVTDTTAAHAASAIANTPAGNLSATTVQAALDELQGDIDGFSAGANGFNYTAQSTTYSAVVNDYIKCTGASFTITLPTAVGNAGKMIAVLHAGTNLTHVYTFNTTSGQTMGGVASGSFKHYTNGEVTVFISDGANWQIHFRKAVTDWIDAGAITITALGTACVKGTTSRDKFWWKREGKTCYFRYEYLQTAGGTNGTSGYYFTVPTGLGLDSSVLLMNSQSVTDARASMIGEGIVSSDASGIGSSSTPCKVISADSSSFMILPLNRASAADGLLMRILGGTTTGFITGTFGLNTTNLSYIIKGYYPQGNWQP